MRIHGLAPAFVALVALPLLADVFWRIPRRADSALQELGGSCVYTTDVTINGAPGTLSAYAFAETAASVSAGLARKLKLAAPAAAGAFITCTDKGRVTRTLVLPSSAKEESCVALTLSQTASDASRARGNGADWPPGLPALPGKPLFSAVCSATRTAFVSASTDAAPEAAVQDAAGAFRQAGWTETSPATPTFRTFVSGRKISLVIALRDEKEGWTTISVLQREGATP